MTRADSALLTRLDAVTVAIDSLHAVLASQESVVEALQQVARNAVEAVPAVDAVSITVLGDAPPRTLAVTDELALALDAEQYRGDEGPCLEAARTGRPVRVTMDSAHACWPRFAGAAERVGVRASLSIPLLVASEWGEPATELAGSLNAYSVGAQQFDEYDEKLLSLYTTAAVRAVETARRWKLLQDNVAQLEAALVSRSDIDQAKGALRVLNGGSAETAFDILVQRSQHENVKLRDVARQVIDELSRDLPDTP